MLQSFFEYKWQPIGTPLRGGLNRAGEYFENTDSKTAPIVEACQQNYTILMTDGYWNDPDPLPAKIADNDGDGISPTLADVSQYYYSKDLSPLNNQVVTTDFDQADWQHMVTYTIAFGLHGLLVDDDNDGWPGTAPGLLENGLWGNPFNGKSRPEKIDDLWHAAYNGRGQFIAASSPEEISKALQDALASIGKEYNTSAAVAFNGGSLQNSTVLYQVKFKNFTGDLEAYPYDAALKDFSGSPKWSAAGLLNSLPSPHTSRAIITRNDSQGVAFDWLGLSANQKADLLVDPNGATGSATKAQARVDYIRGDKSNEVGGGFNFRKRDSLLGDIINSSPVSVGKPKATWPNAAPFPTTAGQTYSDFSMAQASRPEMVYVGANDGMLHGFKGADGTEAIAYIPKAVFSATKGSGLHYLTDSNYSHRYYVDMPSVVEDTYFNAGPGSAWHSVLIGGTRSGGKGIFALDVTNPAAFSEANAASIALWEFNSSDDADMGYSFSIPTIAMLNNNRWAAIFGNGYNNNGDGKAKLFILFLDGGLDGIWTAGSDYIELSTNAGSIVAPKNCADPLSDCNGLSTPQTVDTNNDQLVDRVYAGDLKGNLWAFDLSSADAASWGVAYSGNPLFVAANQPITTKPAVVRHPTELNGAAPNVMVFFGTGQYLATADINSAATQGFYGVWDNGSASLTSANLVEQTFFTFTDKAGNTVDAQSTLRVLSDNPVDYSVKHGWYIQFKNGERITTDALIYEEVVLFNTRLPSSTACTSGGNGSRIFVPQATGGRSTFNIFDANKDKVVSAADFLQDASDSNYAVNSVAVKDTFPEQLSVIGNVLVTPLTNMSRLLDILYVPNQGSMKRISWQELQKE
ncbi:hypothetical protein CRENPOLYSF2_900001 [Crenothrix polyspora]|uniref:PilY1 beta-propeller domain-containing protein n=1 Tax=Crenothrix polyspora TaxID=360316 RepID=A0A1R4HIY4_9GAMM|nr:hypothetical protein CRENPOLYSF2_900001 [Crenothrix polyspora]